MIKANNSGVIISSIIPIMVGKSYKGAYSKAKTRDELELMYVFGTDSVQRISTRNLSIFRSSNHMIQFISHNNICYIDIPIEIEKEFSLNNKSLVSISLSISYILNNMSHFEYMHKYIREMVLKHRKYYNYGDCVEINKESLAIVKPGYYLYKNIVFKGIVICCYDKKLHLLFHTLYDLLYRDSKNVILYENFIKLSINAYSHTINAGRVVHYNGKYNIIYPLNRATKAIFIADNYNCKMNISYIKKGTYETNMKLVPREKKLFMVRYKYINNKKYDVCPPYSNSTYRLGYVYDTHIDVNTVSYMNIRIHNYRFHIYKCRYSDIIFL